MQVKYLHVNRFSNLTLSKANQAFVDVFVDWSWRILGLASIAQGLLWTTPQNLFAICVVLLAWKLITTFVLPFDVLDKFPLSSFLILGYGLIQFYFPLLFTLLEAKPITFNLDSPYAVFLHSLFGITVVVASHRLYRSLRLFTAARQGLQKTLWKLKLFVPPSAKQIWFMGAIGLGAMLYAVIGSQSGQEFSGNGNKFVQGLIPFVYAPFYLFLRPLYGRGKAAKRTAIFLIAYSILLFAVSIMRNSRGAFMYGFAGLGFSYGLALLLNMIQPKFFTSRNLVAGILGLWLLTGPLSDLGTAMVITREQRGDVSASALLSQTLEVYKDKEALRAYTLQTTGDKSHEFDEYYLDNLFLSRFCNLKYNDLSLGMAEKLGGINADCRKHTIESTVSILPQPLLHLLAIDVDKEKVNSFSNGDLLIDLTGGKDALGGYMVGHFAGVGMASFGWWYLALLFLLLLPAFLLWDALAVTVQSVSKGKRWVFSLTALLSMITVFQFITFESVLDITQFLLRNWLQMIFLYLLLFHTTTLILKPKARR